MGRPGDILQGLRLTEASLISLGRRSGRNSINKRPAREIRGYNLSSSEVEEEFAHKESTNKQMPICSSKRHRVHRINWQRCCWGATGKRVEVRSITRRCCV